MTTNHELIKKMSIEEMAVVIMCPVDIGMTVIECDRASNAKCVICTLEWLKQEA
jgi:hypothetical protein